MTKMRSARLHAINTPMVIDEVEKPVASGSDVVIQVKACGLVPNLANVLNNWESWYPHQPLPPKPATFGLDPAGVVTEVGDQVVAIKPGDRVYVNPLRSCGACHECASGAPMKCDHFTFNGYFGFGPQSAEIYKRYPDGGFAEFMRAPQSAIVKIPDNMTFTQAARLGYLGTSYSALKKFGGLSGKTLIINGASGTLGVGATMFALAMGVARIFAVARGRPLLERIKALAPSRIETFSTEDGSTAEWVRSLTGTGANFMLDCLGAKADTALMKDAMMGVRRGGTIVNIGGTGSDMLFNTKWWMDNSMTLIGSAWLTTAEGMEMAAMVETGVIDLSVLETKAFPLDAVNEAIGGAASGSGGFTSYVLQP
ncbi:alcohol dehydrogenase catalytic domain-containing protein [Aurantiacibacter suaedae]|uniref:alcohol dehydrogenase catalytic domain-containing protein n=1 Tax=Aurantiacibacter suaedae TaxID=2545755 RepID=UPI0010F8B459|nr:alcohol dehydrogenase catalytic domain-containing protein [Aurantiacibacter suaedae]